MVNGKWVVKPEAAISKRGKKPERKSEDKIGLLTANEKIKKFSGKGKRNPSSLGLEMKNEKKFGEARRKEIRTWQVL